MPSAYRVAHLDRIEPVRGQDYPEVADWKPVRHDLGIEAFGVNAFVVGSAGDLVIDEHDETDYGHEELYVVIRGHAEFTVAGEKIDAPAGTFVFVPDPEVRRQAFALEPDTAVLGVGAKPGEPFSPSKWEQEYTAGRGSGA
jgi:quercetin dioxygenase-like cupin family protein